VALNVAVVGYVSTTGSGGSLVPLRRDSLNGANPLSVGQDPVGVVIAGRAGVPSDARAVVLNVRRPSGSKVSSVWAWRAGAAKPGPSSWRRGHGGPTAQRVIVPIGDAGEIRVAADRVGKIGLDVAGYVAAGDQRKLHPVVPRQLTKSGLRIKRGHSVNVSVRGRAGVHTDATAALVEVTGINPSHSAGITVWARGHTRPHPADLLVPRRQSRETLALVPIGDRGDIRVHAASGSAGVRVTVVGWVS
jgi:hypothetical protein